MSIGSINSAALQSLTSTVFNRLDSKQTGAIDSEDLQAAFNTDTSELFTTLDSDGDGSITQTEFSDGIQTLVDALQSQLQSSRLQSSDSEGMGMMPPPPPPPMQGTDEGFTQEELTSMSAEIADSDSRMSTLMSNLASNFDSADTDGNGRISHDEAMAFDQSQQTASTDSTTTDSDSSVTDNAQLLAQLVQLLQNYGVAEQSTTSLSTAA